MNIRCQILHVNPEFTGRQARNTIRVSWRHSCMSYVAFLSLIFSVEVRSADVEIIEHLREDNVWTYAKVSAAYSKDGTLGVLLGSGKLREVRVNGSVTESYFPDSGIVLYDSTGHPHVFVEDNDVILHYSSTNSEIWTQSETIPGQLSYSADNLVVGRDDSFHIAWSTWNGPIMYASNKSGRWQSSTIVPFSGTELYVYGVAIDQNSKIHILYSEYDCKYASNESGAWQTELVYKEPDWPEDGSYPTTPYYTDPQFAVYPNGDPIVVAVYKQRVPTGSVIYNQLHVLRRASRVSWFSEVIADKSDNFYGSDGDKYTGYEPELTIDNNNSAHVLFSDGYVQHDPHQECQLGQIRHAVNSGGRWETRTIFAQNPNPQFTAEVEYSTGEQDVILRSIMEILGLAVSSDGQNIHAFGLRWPSTADGYEADLIHVKTHPPVPPVPLIMANGSPDNIAINSTNNLSITVQLDPGDYVGTEVDWWVVALARAGEWYYLDNAMQWTLFNGDFAFCQPAYQGPLFNLSSTPVLTGFTLPNGTYNFWFAVDYPMDGILTLSGPIIFDGVTVVVQ